MSKNDEITKFKQDFVQKLEKEKRPFERYTRIGRILFTWMSPYIYLGSNERLDYDVMPNLPHEFKHVNYSNKSRYFFKRAMDDFKKNGQKTSKTFILRLVWSCYKWDILLCLVLVLVLKLLEYSTAFFIQSILQIKDHYAPSQYQTAFITLAGSMICLKIVNSITSENVGYFFVN